MAVFVKSHRRGKSIVKAYKRAIKAGKPTNLGPAIKAKYLATVRHMDKKFFRSVFNERLLFNIGKRAKGKSTSIYG